MIGLIKKNIYICLCRTNNLYLSGFQVIKLKPITKSVDYINSDIFLLTFVIFTIFLIFNSVSKLQLFSTAAT